MDVVSKELINQKIDELLQMARDTNSPLLVLMKENDDMEGKHFCAYGSGRDLSDLVVRSASTYPGLKVVLKDACKKL